MSGKEGRKVYIVISFCVCELRIAQPLSVGLSFLRHAGTVVDARAEPRWLSTYSVSHVCTCLTSATMYVCTSPTTQQA